MPQVLVVEDDAEIQDTLVSALHEEGYAAEGVSNGQSALARLRSGPAPDLVLLDLRMPVMDGWEFRSIQRADPALASIPVVVVSVDASPKATAIDAARFISKPFRLRDLLVAVAEVLAERQRPPALTSRDLAAPVAMMVANLAAGRDALRRAHALAAGLRHGGVRLAGAPTAVELEGILEEMDEILRDASEGAAQLGEAVRRMNEARGPGKPQAS